MIIISLVLFGATIYTTHFSIGIDLPARAWVYTLFGFGLKISTGNVLMTVPPSSKAAIEVDPSTVTHTGTDPAFDPTADPGSLGDTGGSLI